MIEIKPHSHTARNELFTVILFVWLFCTAAAFFTLGINGPHHPHRFDHIGWLLLGLILIPSSLFIVTWATIENCEIRRVSRSERKARKARDEKRRMRELEAGNEQAFAILKEKDSAIKGLIDE